MQFTILSLFLLVLIITISKVQSKALFVVVTEFVAQDSETAQYITKVNLNTGELTNVVETMVFAGGSITVDGISTFDEANGVYYYSTDAGESYVFNADVRNKKLLPTISLNVEETDSLAFDNKNTILYGTVSTKTVNGLIAFPTSEKTPYKVLYEFPDTFNFRYVVSSHFDSNAQVLYMLTQYGQNATGINTALSTVDVTSSPVTVKSTVLDCKVKLFAQFVTVDEKNGTVYTVGQPMSQQYYFATIDMNGNCEQTVLEFKTQGIVTCHTYDPQDEIIYIGYATNGGAYIYGFDIASKTLDTGILIKGVVPESMEFSSSD